MLSFCFENNEENKDTYKINEKQGTPKTNQELEKEKKKDQSRGGMIYLKRDLTLEKPVEKEDLAACCWAIRLA